MKFGKPLMFTLVLASTVVAATAVYVIYPRNASVLKVGSDVVALVSPGSAFGTGASNAAQFSGALEVIGNGCLGIRAGDDEMAVAFPHGTKVAPGASGLILPGGVQIAVGDEISGGGGGREITAEDNWVAERWPQASRACGGLRSAVALDNIRVIARP